MITVEQLYNYAIQHNYLHTDANIVLDIINRDRNLEVQKESIVSPVNNTSTIDFSTLVEYSIEDLLKLLSL